MTPVRFGIWLAMCAWGGVSLGVLLAFVGGALIVDPSDPIAAAIYGCAFAALFLLPALGLSICIGLAGWAWARMRPSAVSATGTTSLSARGTPHSG